MKYVLITGVSSGIGNGTLSEFMKRGYHVFGSVRKEEDADQLSAQYPERFTPLIFDVTKCEEIQKATSIVSEQLGKQGLSCLVNNSGIAIGGPLMHQELEVIQRHFDVNVIGLMSVTKAFLPYLGARENHEGPTGKIINISSVAGKVAAPFVGAYVGSKHAVEGLSHSLRRELLIYGIDVIIVGPGAVKTPIWDKGMKMEPYLDTAYEDILKRFAKGAKKGGEDGLSIEYLGKRIADISEKSKPKARYAIVPNKFKNWVIPKLLPDRWLDRIIKKQLLGNKK